jgi:signal transduction histidine kinase
MVFFLMRGSAMRDDRHVNPEHPTAPLLRRLRVSALVALSIVLLLLTMIGWRDYEARFGHVELRDLAQARTLAGHAARGMDSVDAIMQRLGDRLARIMRVGDPPPAVLHEMLGHAAANSGLIRYLSLVAPDGSMLADSRRRTIGDRRVAGFERLETQLQLEGRDRIAVVRDGGNASDMLLAVRRVEAGYRGDAVILTAGLSTRFFRGFYEDTSLARASEIGLLSATGTVLAATERFIGQGRAAEGRDLSALLPLDELGNEPSQTFVAEQWDSTVGLAWVSGWPLVVMVATDVRPLIWDWAFVAGTLGLAGLLVIAGTGAALRLGARYLNRLADTENELRLRVVDLEISRLELQRQGQEATGLAEALYVAREEAEQAREDAEAARCAADRANRTKSEFLARMSHELRTPLNAILGFAEIMKEGIGATGRNDTYTQYSQDIYESGSHLLSVINDILDLAKVEAGRFELAEEEVDLDYAARSVARLVRETAAKRGLKLLVDVPAGMPRLRSDQRVVRQMLLNLLSNALKFTPRGGSVSVIVRLDGAGLALAVRDTGIGIEEKNFAKVLQPFGQVRDPSTEEVQGTGLGLPLVKSFVEAQGGRFELDSRVGEGTTVTLWFPPERIIPPCRAADAGGVLSEAC